MLFTILISVALVLVIFAIVSKRTKKTEQPTVPVIDEEPLGYETSSLADVIESEETPIEPVVPEIIKEQPQSKAKKKTSAKPKTSKAPKKKKDA